MSKREEFVQKVDEVKGASKEMLKTLDELLASQVDGMVKLSRIGETISVEAVNKMKAKVEEIINTEITTDNYPTLKEIDMSLKIEYSPYDELVDDLTVLRYDIYAEEMLA